MSNNNNNKTYQSLPLFSLSGATNYDPYYTPGANGEPSEYDRQFLSKINGLESELVLSKAKALYQKIKVDKDGRRVMRIVDFGFGNGRWLSVYEEIAAFMKEKGIEVEVVAYDPNPRGLSEFIKKIINSDGYSLEANDNGLGFIDQGGRPEGNKSYKVGSFSKDGLKFTIICGHERDKVKHLASVLGHSDMTVSMFCPMAHIVNGAKRIST